MLLLIFSSPAPALAADVVGVTVTPHVVADTLRYRRPRDPGLAARVQLFVSGTASRPRFNDATPAELLAGGAWSWHDLETAVPVPAGALSVWTFNGRTDDWGVGRRFTLAADGLEEQKIEIAHPQHWMSAITFLGSAESASPESIIVHVANESEEPLQVTGIRLWLPESNQTWNVLWPRSVIDAKQSVLPRDRGYVQVATGPLPLTYTAVELITESGSLWSHLRVKREAFDISGGWVGEHLTREPYLRLLQHLHVNTGHFDHVPGYSDNPDLYAAYPLKLFHRLQPIEHWDSDEWLPRIHAVEFLGEPQYGGGRPVPPQEVFDELLPYRSSRLPTSVTHSEERIWRNYAGLSDYPHYDAYRVVAPAADAWTQYDRWDGRTIRWGAPLETIGDLCRSLRELNRPLPCAYWSQGPHDGWRSIWSVRTRRSPTPDELRAQALHALSTRITSLYWFNLSLKSLMRYPDTWEAMTRLGREIRMLEPYYLAGDAYRFERRNDELGQPDWDLASIAAPEAALLFALETAYVPDPEEHVFVFGPPRPVTFQFELPPWLRDADDLFRVDADGIHEVTWRIHGRGVIIEDVRSRDAVYIATSLPELRQQIEARRQACLDHEVAHPIDMQALQAVLDGTP